VLAIIAYKQPVTRAELEHVRGVDTGAVLKSLLERRMVKILGQREVPGRPMIYGTSKRFLEVFGLESLQKLPTLRELEDLAREQGVELPGIATIENLGEEMEEVQEGLSADGAESSEGDDLIEDGVGEEVVEAEDSEDVATVESDEVPAEADESESDLDAKEAEEAAKPDPA
jgi:segregation and condensation protein B